MIARRIALAVILSLLLPLPSSAETPEELSDRALDLFSPVHPFRDAALDYFLKRGKPDVIPVLILAERFMPESKARTSALETLTGSKANDWFHWMLWQEAHPEIAPLPGFDALQASVYRTIDTNFGLFLKAGVAHEIRLEEITWGGVLKDGIPALTNPKLIAPAAATYLQAGELVFGIAINGDERAYPLRIMDWHEMLNDRIGGVALSLAYCTLCGSGILFETEVAGRKAPFVFGSSGFLYRSNKLMYDSETNSLWNQFTGRPVVGPLTGSGITLRTRPVVITRWGDWLGQHPNTRVLDISTGVTRDYRPGRPYGDYFASVDLMFPALVDESRLKQKDYVFALRSSGTEKAWALKLFEGGAVINDRAGVIDLVLIGEAASRTVRAYRTDGRTFAKGASPDQLASGGAVWQVAEDALTGPDGTSFPRLPGHIAYWFAWNGYFGSAGEPSAP